MLPDRSHSCPNPSRLDWRFLRAARVTRLAADGYRPERARSMRTVLPDPKQRALQLALRIEASAAGVGAHMGPGERQESDSLTLG